MQQYPETQAALQPCLCVVGARNGAGSQVGRAMAWLEVAPAAARRRCRRQWPLARRPFAALSCSRSGPTPC